MLIDPLGHRLTMAELYPWPFDPGYLGEPGYCGDTNGHSSRRRPLRCRVDGGTAARGGPAVISP